MDERTTVQEGIDRLYKHFNDLSEDAPTATKILGLKLENRSYESITGDLQL
jgi:hypothetical protein